MKMKKRCMGMIMLVCLLVGMLPVNVWASSELGEKLCAITIWHKGTPLNGTVITATLVDADMSTWVRDLGTTSEGQLKFLLDPIADAGKYVEIKFSVPEGYSLEFNGGVLEAVDRLCSPNGGSVDWVAYNLSEIGTYTWRVLYDSKPLNDTKMTAYLTEGSEDKNRIYLGSSENGELTVHVNDAKPGDRRCVWISVTLPEGYWFSTIPLRNSVTFYEGQMMELDLRNATGISLSRAWENNITNPSLEGIWETNISSITVEKGQRIDLRGAFDRNSNQNDIQLYHIAPDGTRTRVYADDYENPNDGILSYTTMGNFEVKAEKVGETDICFLISYGDGVRPVVIRVIVVDNIAGNQGNVQEDNSDFVSSSSEDSVNQTETVYIAADGREVRQISSIENSAITIVGNPEIILSGMRFKADRVTSGSGYDRATEVISRQLNSYGSYQVFEMNLWDASGAEVHQMGGYVNVTLPVPESLTYGNGTVLTVYRVEDNGSLTRCNTAVRSGMLTFSTDHFSTFVVVERAASTSPLTSEDGALFLWITLAFVAAVGFAAVGRLAGKCAFDE